MKIRTGFVSNSSSSSFLIVAKRIASIEDLKNAKNPYMYGFNEYGDASPFIELNKEKIDFLVNSGLRLFPGNQYGWFVDVAETHEEEVSLKKLKEVLPEFDDFMVTVIEASYHSPDEMGQFKSYVGEEDED